MDAEPVRVRVATPDEVDAFMDLVLLGAEENSVTPPSPAKILHDVYPALNLDQGIVGVIGPVGGPLEGGVLLRITTAWYTETPTLEERGIYVHPDYRRINGGRSSHRVGHARCLIEFSKRVSDRLGIPLSIGVLSNQHTEAKVRLYKRLLGEPAGAYFLYNAVTGGAVKEDVRTPSNAALPLPVAPS